VNVFKMTLGKEHDDLRILGSKHVGAILSVLMCLCKCICWLIIEVKIVLRLLV